ncbi:MAG: tRNA pseudouridine(38-40) synthase TruA [Tannerellaceae bacterium]|jgi:tRNA pseudouridine38-40 synthase|nr:tRNA pseudouridine(38-40) synthase TruA [Tannerellaceae bacterium]
MNRYFIYLAYNGKNYCGWQIQPNAPSVQQTLEKALGIYLQRPTPVVGAGRTDAGVHARGMVAHFDGEEGEEKTGNLPLLTGKLNRLLPKDIAIAQILPVRSDAHARFDALSRTYHYYITSHKNPFNQDQVCRLAGDPDFEAMNKACAELYPYTDFSSFSKLHSGAKTNLCHITHAAWENQGDVWRFTITANRFLRNMVRAIVGTLLDVGRGKLTSEDFRAVIEAENRAKAGCSAPAHALFLENITYPESVFQK